MPDLQTALTNALAKEKPMTLAEQLRAKLDAWTDDERTTQLTQPKEKPMQAVTMIKKPNAAATQTSLGQRGFGVTNNVTRATFDHIKNNPGVKTMAAVDALEKQGFKRGSTTSICSQLVTCGQVVRAVDGGLHVAVKEYLPISIKKNGKKKISGKVDPKKLPVTMRKKLAVKVVKAKAGIAALPAGTAGVVKHPSPYVMESKQPAITDIVKGEWDADTLINHLGLKQAHALYKELGKYFGG